MPRNPRTRCSAPRGAPSLILLGLLARLAFLQRAQRQWSVAADGDADGVQPAGVVPEAVEEAPGSPEKAPEAAGLSCNLISANFPMQSRRVPSHCLPTASEANHCARCEDRRGEGRASQEVSPAADAAVFAFAMVSCAKPKKAHVLARM